MKGTFGETREIRLSLHSSQKYFYDQRNCVRPIPEAVHKYLDVNTFNSPSFLCSQWAIANWAFYFDIFITPNEPLHPRSLHTALSRWGMCAGAETCDHIIHTTELNPDTCWEGLTQTCKQCWTVLILYNKCYLLKQVVSHLKLEYLSTKIFTKS